MQKNSAIVITKIKLVVSAGSVPEKKNITTGLRRWVHYYRGNNNNNNNIIC
jgi:hypothetical protein